jgi:hypothetical protein
VKQWRVAKGVACIMKALIAAISEIEKEEIFVSKITVHSAK